MEQEKQVLVDARRQVRQALEQMETRQAYCLRNRYPRGAAEETMVIWFEYSNVNTRNPVVDQIVFQVDLYTQSPESQQELAEAVNTALTGLGLRRVYAGPDRYDESGLGYYRKSFRFGRKVDKRTLRLID